ncbi:helix-turn-helix transcriptional regulator [Roseibium sp.]|uniref:helix-turn-helix transcriptional regulator n=1 Tax=Roseibium sp. TaxID=1936156 RepID=UPI003BAD7A24
MTDATVENAGYLSGLYSSVNGVQNPSELYAKLRRITEDLQFGHYVVLFLPQVTDENIRPSIVASNWSGALLAAYDRLKLLENSPIIAGLRQTDEPVEYDLETKGIDRPEEEQSAAINLFLEHEMPRGVYFGCHDKTGRRGAIGFAGERPLPSPAETAILHLISQHIFSRLYALMGDLGEKLVLSSREIECLVWSARGKTSSECATILGVAESTVAGYIASLNRKLHAQNKTQMIAIAYELGLISNANVGLR